MILTSRFWNLKKKKPLKKAAIEKGSTASFSQLAVIGKDDDLEELEDGRYEVTETQT